MPCYPTKNCAEDDGKSNAVLMDLKVYFFKKARYTHKL